MSSDIFAFSVLLASYQMNWFICFQANANKSQTKTMRCIPKIIKYKKRVKKNNHEKQHKDYFYKVRNNKRKWKLLEKQRYFRSIWEIHWQCSYFYKKNAKDACIVHRSLERFVGRSVRRSLAQINIYSYRKIIRFCVSM